MSNTVQTSEPDTHQTSTDVIPCMLPGQSRKARVTIDPTHPRVDAALDEDHITALAGALYVANATYAEALKMPDPAAALDDMCDALPEIMPKVLAVVKTTPAGSEVLKAAITDRMWAYAVVEHARAEAGDGYGYLFTLFADALKNGADPHTIRADALAAPGRIRELAEQASATVGALPEPSEIRSAGGLVYRVVPATGYTARVARDVRTLTMDDGRVWTVGTRGRGSTFAWRPAAEQQPAPRCPAAHPEDPTPCTGPVVVTVLDATNAGADGCEHHAARLLASLDGARVYPLPDAPDGAAIRVFKAAIALRPFCWAERGETR